MSGPPLRHAFVFVSVAFAISLSGCSGCGNDPGAVPCEGGVDGDGDFYGEGCPSGPDCNDLDPNVHEDCCGYEPTSQGCECDPAIDTVVPCFDGDEALSNNPPCMKGTRTCLDGAWGVCVGQSLPEQEVCDGTDNDCDLQSDEGVTSACGNCLAGCDQVVIGDDPFPFPEDDPTVMVDGEVVSSGRVVRDADLEKWLSAHREEAT